MQKKEKIVNPEYLTCPIRNVLAKFGDKWSLLVLYHLYVSENGVMRFNELRRNMTDCSQKMLSQTLKNLESNHLVNRKLYPVVPPRVEYEITVLGQSLEHSIQALAQWMEDYEKQLIHLK